MAAQSSSSSFNYDVYLSFRGLDTRYGFTGNLYHALCNRGIHTFIDDEELRSGEEITPSLVKAIEESRIAIIVLSENYAPSSFCLDELATIIDCNSKGMLVITVFYGVDPSDVRHHKGNYGEALAKHEERFKHKMDKLQKLQKWKMALRQVADISGYYFKKGDYEYKFIDRIVASVSEIINHPARLRVGDYLVGLNSRVAGVMKLLDVESDDGVHIIGIHGMGGVGKSTLARAVYNLIAEKFDGLCYHENVREKSNKQGLKHLQSLLLQERLIEKNINVTSVEGGASMIPQRLKQKKVLLLVDDVNNIDQLKAIVGSPDWLGPGSIVIITTRDKQLLTFHEVKKTCKVKELNENNALELLTRKAFRKENVAIYRLSSSFIWKIELTDLLKKFVNLISLKFDKCKFLTQIPDVSDLPNLEILSFKYCKNLVTVQESVGFLEKLTILSAEDCSKLESFPPIKLTSLEILELSNCSSLESFPEILGKMENITSLRLTGTPIKELPMSFQYLINLQDLSLYGLPSSIAVMPKLTQSKGGQWVEQEEDEEKVFSKLEWLDLIKCNLKDDFFSIGFTLFHHVKYLNLSENNFTILPEYIKEFQSLRCLDVSDCKHLQEIKGVPPNIKFFNARNCKSLSSLSISMLMNQELYEARMRQCIFAGACVPEWFDQKSRGPSTSFWFRNNFPHKVLCLLIAPVEDKLGDDGIITPMVFINGKVHEPYFDIYLEDMEDLEMDHTYIFDLDWTLRYDQFEVPLENEWNHVEVTFVGVIEASIIKATGIHVFKHENNEDIQFFKPYEKRKPLVYDVFLNFKGSDTLHGFTGYLYKALHDSGIHTFIDDKELQRGEEITPEIVKAIEESRIAVTVFSINYAYSSFCLDELASILDCLKRKRLLVLPVFYNVDPSDVKHQIGSYGEALAKHEERFKHNMDKLQKWKMALHQVANLPGFHFKHGDGYEYEFIGRIVEWVSSEIKQVPGYPIGLQSQVLDVMKLLNVGCDDVFMIGICGIGGVGKSTLTREVYNLIADHFDASCFIENVREKSKKHGLQHLQSILLLKLLGDNDITLSSEKEGISMIQRRLQRKKVLLILDDVDRHEQLQAVVGEPHRFGSGSKVIITTQDEELLASDDVQKTYKVKELNKNDAFQLLKWKAFKAQYIDPRYEELLNRAVTYASGLPLSLEIIGSNLFGKSLEEWKSAIHQLEKSPNDPIQSILKAIFGALEEKAMSIFLDICCCFNGYKLTEIQDILHAHYGHCVKDYIDELVDKSLLKLSHGTKHCYDTITLHDLIEDMGKEIDQQESLAKPDERKRLWLLEDIREVLGIKVRERRMGKEIERQESLTSQPAKRRRLWSPQDVREVLGYNKGIEIICLDFPTSDKEETIEWDGTAFQNMQNLKTLIIRNCNFSKGPEYLPNSLRVLEWWRYPSHHLPSGFHPKELTICKLPYSHISTIELTDLMKKFPNLRVLEFSSANV